LLKVIQTLNSKNIHTTLVETSEEARALVEKIISQGARVMTMTSATLDTVGMTKVINESGKYLPVRAELTLAEGAHKRELGAAPDWAIGSVNAITEVGAVIIASNTGSQMPAYAYGAKQVIWVVGAQKIVKDLNEALERIYEYVLPLEDARARKAYGVGSNVSKMLIINQEVAPNRIYLILVNQVLGF